MKHIIPFLLVASVTGCLDEANPTHTERRTAELNLQALAQENLGDIELVLGQEHTDASLLIEYPTVRDIHEGRIPHLVASSSFATTDEEPCPQRRAEGSGTSAAPIMEIAIDFTSEELLDTPLEEACIHADGETGALRLVFCDEPSSGLASEHGSILELTSEDDGLAAGCYWCDDRWPCTWSGKTRREEGTVFWFPGMDPVCIAYGWNGCC